MTHLFLSGRTHPVPIGKQGPAGPHSPSINRLGCPERNGVGFRDNNWDGNGGGGYPGACKCTHNRRDSYPGSPDVCGQADRSRTPRGCPVARPDRNRRPYLPDVQYAAYKWVSHVAEHCDMLATAICLECYMKNDLSTLVQDTIERDWLAKWKERLGNPANTPRQVMRTYVEALDITVAHLNNKMDWAV
jgi:hypothetical protein